MNMPTASNPKTNPWTDVWQTLAEVAKRLVATEKGQAAAIEEMRALRNEIAVVNGRVDQLSISSRARRKAR